MSFNVLQSFRTSFHEKTEDFDMKMSFLTYAPNFKTPHAM